MCGLACRSPASQERVPVEDMPRRFHQNLPVLSQGRESPAKAKVELEGKRETIHDGYVVIASLTSCTNTSAPMLMLAAGLVARKALALGLAPKRWVRASLAPGSRVVTGYLAEAGLLEPLEALGFALVGYGCATCIGNSGPLPEELVKAVVEEKLVVAAVLSGNRNFEARIHPAVRANYLASPPLVVAYALAGTVDIDLANEPLCTRGDGRPVYLRDLWPAEEELADLADMAVRPELFTLSIPRRCRHRSLAGAEGAAGVALRVGRGFYIRQGTAVLRGVQSEPSPPGDIRSARVLAILGDSVTTDHISPAGSIPANGPAGRYLLEQGVAPADFNTYGTRRGNHEVLLRGTFANVRLRNFMAGGREGGWTTHHPSGELTSIYEAAMRYKAEATPLVIFAGKEYGTGSSRDWAAKGTALLGVRAVIAESFERIHRSNLVGMGVLPLELEPGVTVESLGLTGAEMVDIEGIEAGLDRGSTVQVHVWPGDADAGSDPSACLDPSARPAVPGRILTCKVRLDSTVDLEDFRHGGVLPRVLRLKLGV